MATDNQEQTPEQNAQALLQQLLNEQNSLLRGIERYKRENDGSFGNKRKTTSDFLQNFMQFLEKPFTEMANILKCYNLLLALRYVLQAQENKVKAEELDKSEFIKAILSPLDKVLHENTTTFKQFSRLEKGSKDKKKSIMSNSISTLDGWLTHFSTTYPHHGLKSDENLSLAVQRLFDYCAEKELDSQSKIEKRVQVYKVLELYFKAQTADDYVGLFEEIAKGIQASRTQGINGEKSRGSEHALVAFRDWLVYKLFIDTQTKSLISFDQTQIEKILNQVSYKLMPKQKGDKTDVDVSRYTMEMISLLTSKNAKTLNELRIEYIKRLIFQIPDKINNSEINKTQYCFDKGPAFAQAIQTLLEDQTLTPSQKEEVGIYAFMWNMYMVDAYASKEKPDNKNTMTTDYLVNYIHAYVNPFKIRSSTLLPDSIRKDENKFNHYWFQKDALAYTLGNKQPTLNPDQDANKVLSSGSFNLLSTSQNNTTSTISNTDYQTPGFGYTPTDQQQ